MALAAALMLWAGRGLSFFSDEHEYFARAVDLNPPQGLTLEYLFAPYNGHLQLVGKLIYEAMFATAGANYFPYRLLEVVLYLACVVLFFVLLRPRIGAWAGVAACVLMLFLGAAWEVMIWPFDLHTLLPLAAGLAALIALERERPWSDVACCILLVVAIATIEVGFAFAVGVAVSILLRPDRRERLWIFLVPVVLYAAWTLWARKFDQSEIDPVYLSNLATSVPASLAATASALTGMVELGNGVQPFLVRGLGPDRVFAVVLVIAFVWRISRGPVPPTTWVFASVLGSYWVFITLAHRQPETSRFLLVDAMLAVLVIADLVGPVRVRGRALALVWGLVAIALPLNLATLFNGRDALLEETELTASEYTMLELARQRVDPAFSPAESTAVQAAGAAPVFSLTAGAYFDGAERIGSIAMPIERLRDSSQRVRIGADATLVGAYEVALSPSTAPADRTTCQPLGEGPLELPAGGALLAVSPESPEPVALSRFSDATGPGVPIAEAGSRWRELRLPSDAAPERWLLHGPTQTLVCPRAGGG